jgi:hypothetical protein
MEVGEEEGQEERGRRGCGSCVTYIYVNTSATSIGAMGQTLGWVAACSELVVDTIIQY